MNNNDRIGERVVVNTGSNKEPICHSGEITGVAYDYIYKTYIVTLDKPITVPGYDKPWKTIVAVGTMITKEDT